MTLAREVVREVYDRELRTYALATKRLKDLLEVLLADLSEQHGVRDGYHISGEPKAFRAFYEKVCAKDVDDPGRCTDVVRDFARARVVVQTLDDVYRLMDLLYQQEPVVVYRDTQQDYIKRPQLRGYRAFHVHVGVDVPVHGQRSTILCELQIRTAIQDAWGGFTHRDFYRGRHIPEVYESQMSEMSALLASVDRMAARLIRSLARRDASGEEPAGATGSGDA